MGELALANAAAHTCCELTLVFKLLSIFFSAVKWSYKADDTLLKLRG